jgi:hypothetical protein
MLRYLTLSAVAATFISNPAFAQDANSGFEIQLNLSKEVSENSCQVVFRAENHLGNDLEEITLRLAVFGTSGAFMNMLALPLGRMIDGKTRAVQFNLRAACGGISEIVVNDASTCRLAGSEDNSTVCIDRLKVSTLSPIAFGI